MACLQMASPHVFAWLSIFGYIACLGNEGPQCLLMGRDPGTEAVTKLHAIPYHLDGVRSISRHIWQAREWQARTIHAHARIEAANPNGSQVTKVLSDTLCAFRLM